MNVLFDQGTPTPLRRDLPLHNAETAYERGWSVLKNGDLLREAEANGFDVLVTTDQNLKYQQNLAGRTIAVVVLLSTSWPRIQQRLREIQDAIDNITPGSYCEVAI